MPIFTRFYLAYQSSWNTSDRKYFPEGKFKIWQPSGCTAVRPLYILFNPFGTLFNKSHFDNVFPCIVLNTYIQSYIYYMCVHMYACIIIYPWISRIRNFSLIWRFSFEHYLTIEEPSKFITWKSWYKVPPPFLRTHVVITPMKVKKSKVRKENLR